MISDPHGDSKALRAGLDRVASLECDEIWCLGDLVGDPDSAGTLALALDACTIVIAGNHDLLVAERLADAYLESHGEERIKRLRAELSGPAMDILHALPTKAANGELQAAHAALDHPTDHIDDYIDADNQRALADRPYLALGHSHRPFCLTAEGCWLKDPDGLVEVGESAVVSPGSVRQTEHGGTVCVLNTSAATCEWHHVEWPASSDEAAVAEVGEAAR